MAYRTTPYYSTPHVSTTSTSPYWHHVYYYYGLLGVSTLHLRLRVLLLKGKEGYYLPYICTVYSYVVLRILRDVLLNTMLNTMPHQL
jgi:hypothetical protein